MLSANLIQAKLPLEVEFRVSLAQQLVHAMSAMLHAPEIEGLDQWVYATYAALPPDLRAEIKATATLLGDDALWRELVLAEPAHQDFSAIVASLSALTEQDYRGFVDAALIERGEYCEGGPTPCPPLDHPAEVKAWLKRCKCDDECADQAVALIANPAELGTRFIAVVTRFWEQFYRAEYERTLPLMERSVQYHRRQAYSADFATLFTAVTGRLVPAGIDYASVERVVFFPSAHIGPYVSHYRLAEPRSTLFIAYNCRPTGAPEREQTPAVQDLFPPIKALADETRLQILAILNGRELYAQQIVEQLDISQSAVSRHLQLMVAGGVLTVRADEGAKYLSVNEETLAALADKLKSFRKGGSE